MATLDPKGLDAAIKVASSDVLKLIKQFVPSIFMSEVEHAYQSAQATKSIRDTTVDVITEYLAASGKPSP